MGYTSTPDKPLYDAEGHALYLDTGAYLGQGLSAVRLSPTGQVLGTVTVPTHAKDLY